MSNYSRDTVSARFPQAKGTSLARELFTGNFWLSGLAMLKYISRSFRAKQVHGMAFDTDTKNEEFRNWVLRTKPENARQWFPEQLVGLRLPKGFKIPHSAQCDFEFEKQQPLRIMDAAWHARSAAVWVPHPMFGSMTVEEWGKLLQTHIDHHLNLGRY